VLECRCTGGKTYYLRYQDQGGRQRQIKIARVEDVTFAAALKKAQTLRAQAVMGGDPAAAKAVKRATPLYKDLADQHLEHARLHLKSFLDVEALVRLHLLPTLGRLPVNEIDSRTVSQLLAAKRASGLAPATVEKIRITLGRSYELGNRWNVPGTERKPDQRAGQEGSKRPGAVPIGRGSGKATGCRRSVSEPAAAAHRRPTAPDRCSGA
jgi:hypothetical protein